jgi:hypothetical protein
LEGEPAELDNTLQERADTGVRSPLRLGNHIVHGEQQPAVDE